MSQMNPKEFVQNTANSDQLSLHSWSVPLNKYKKNLSHLPRTERVGRGV